MQGEWAGEPVGPDVWETCRELIPAGSVFAFLAGHREVLFPAGMFADMYPSPNGRPSLPPQVLGATVVLQALHGLSDFETVQALRCDLRWKAACGLGLLDTAFDPSLLTYFRRRLARSDDPDRLFAKVRQVVAATGVLTGKHRRALDSTVLDDAVATQDTVTQLIAAVRRVIREVPGASAVAGRWCTAHDYAGPGKPKIAWDDEAARAALVDALVTDALNLLAHLPEQELGEQAANAVGLLALVAGQDVEPAEGSDGRDGRWRIAQKVAEDRVVSTVDPEARHTRKSPEARRDGYRAHLAADPETGIITDEKLTGAAGQENSDPSVAGEFLAAEAGPGDAAPGGTGSADGGQCAGGSGDGQGAGGDLTWYGDSAYGTGDLRDAIEKAGHQAVIKPKPLQAPVPGGLTVDDFTVDEQQGTVTCPAGHTVALSRTRIATFGALCRDCPLRARCTTCKTGRKLVLHERDDLLRAARADWAADTGLREDYMKHRPNVERAVAQAATWRGRRLKLRYRGVAKNHAWLKRRTAVLNLRNLAGRGLARQGGAWVLAT